MMHLRIGYVLLVVLIGAGTIFVSCAPQEVNQPRNPQQNTVNDEQMQEQIKMHLSLGWENYKNKQYDRAIEQFRKVLELDPQNEKAYKFFADACLRHPDTTFIDTALALYMDGIKKFPSTACFYSGLGYVYQKMAASVQSLADSTTDSVTAARLYDGSKKFELLAMDNYYRAVSIRKDDALSASSIGTIWLRQGNLDSALVWFEKSTEIDSSQAGIWDVMAKIYVARGLNEKAATAYGHLSRLNPDDPEYLLKMGQFLAKTGKFQEASQILDQYLKSYPNDYRGYQYMGLVLAADNKYKEALEQLKKAEELNSGSVKLMCDIAATYKDMKRYDSAKSYILKAKKIDPNFGYIFIVEGDIVQQIAMDQVPASGELNMEIKCQFATATNIFRMALRDPDWSAIAQNKIDYLKPYIPTREEIAAYKFIEGKDCGE